MNVTPFDVVSSGIQRVKDSLVNAEHIAKVTIPGVPWDFGELKQLLDTLIVQLDDQLALKAHKSYLCFSVDSPGVVLGRRRWKRRGAELRAWAVTAGRSRSTKKVEASRENIAYARQCRERGKPNKALRLARMKVRRLKYLLKQSQQRLIILEASNEEPVRMSARFRAQQSIQRYDRELQKAIRVVDRLLKRRIYNYRAKDR